MPGLGAITIGQAPRDDLMPEFEAALGRGVSILQRGALDDLSLDQVKALAPGPGDTVLVTRMRDGTEVKVAERHITERLRRCVASLERDGVDLIVLLCTGEFPPLGARTLLIPLDRLLEGVIPGLLPSGRLVAVAPAPEQAAALRERWSRVCPADDGASRVAIEAVSPYTAGDAEMEACARRVAAHRPDLILLDCIGFTGRARSIFRRVAGAPVVLPRSLLARVAGELVAW
jgi:protein AroM